MNWKIFNLYEESYHKFKEVFFKIHSATRSIPFFLTLEGVSKFPCYWNKDFHVPKFSMKDLDPDEKDIVDFFHIKVVKETH